ncbi:MULTISPECIES: heat shock protein transcriptional repressor HspR [Campylobacter]|uniref:Heat shock transcriptional regulator, MerR family n=2 Tax=Campylobacter TaxID=194 RepID=A0A1X9T1Q3_9BACT|nr:MULTISPECIES: helix-turn-helix transcriptional regulator [Campylobacter]MCR8690007.1 helix-turn-helix transcriptional regulator [Campylobacter sp. RM9264]MCR8700395.1 helix-turn-helix transcriptional regulator [Campylobacter sp. RM12176]MEE3711700.1 helix-turn-helix transcriptional regulator [Campylobacter sp. CLAX-7218-21]ARQ99012.1 heat shock transcriptional regulator, MerR family [Campylobacter lanienae]ARR02401.1 heat shock transcriptional regulator, MerR family [Campylobacter sp. RM896
MRDYEEPVYLISVVAKVLSIHPQTLRQYEREGLVEPSRTEGKMRLYSEKDLDRIKMILRLTRDLGVNLAGVDVILRLKQRLEEYEAVIEELRANIKTQNKGSLVKRGSSFDLIFVNDKK